MSNCKRVSRYPVAMSCVLGALLLDITGRAEAVVNVREEAWQNAASIPPAPHITQSTVRFVADLTLRDVTQGVTFYILTVDVDGNRDLFAAIWAQMADLPRPGTAVSFELRLDASCSIDEPRLWPSGSSGWIEYIRNGESVRRLIGWAPGSGAYIAEPFGFAVQDEDGNLGPNPSARTLVCNAGPGTIGVYFDPEGTVCQGTIRPGVPATVYVVAKLNEQSPRMSGAEFRFVGLPASWQIYPVANAEMLALGDPFGHGTVLAFPACRQPINGVEVLYTVAVLASSERSDLEFSIAMREPPTHPGFQCPLLLDCDVPLFTKYCVRSVPCFVNASTPKPCPVAEAVESSDWGRVKALYRD